MQKVPAAREARPLSMNGPFCTVSRSSTKLPIEAQSSSGTLRSRIPSLMALNWSLSERNKSEPGTSPGQDGAHAPPVVGNVILTYCPQDISVIRSNLGESNGGQNGLPSRVAIIGAGSVGFTKKLVTDILCVAEFADVEIRADRHLRAQSFDGRARSCESIVAVNRLPAK